MTGFDVAAWPTNASAPAGATANHGHARWEKCVATLTQVQRADASSAKQPTTPSAVGTRQPVHRKRTTLTSPANVPPARAPANNAVGNASTGGKPN